jgi:hypothetical protein
MCARQLTLPLSSKGCCHGWHTGRVWWLLDAERLRAGVKLAA